MAVFAPTGFLPVAAAAVWGESEADARTSIERLQDGSLVMDAEQVGRFKLHDLLRDYAAAKLNESGEGNAANRAHAEFLIQLFEQHAMVIPDNVPFVSNELDNLRRAANWAREKNDGELLARLATVPRNWLGLFSIWDEWQGWLTDALRVGKDYNRQLKANVLQAMGDVQQFRKDMNTALASYAQALELFRAVGSKLGEANVLAARGQTYLLTDPAQADALLTQAIELYEQIGSRYSVPAMIGNFGWALLRLDQPKRARPYLLRAAELFEHMGLTDYAERHRKAARR